MDAVLLEFDSFVRSRTPALLRSAYLLTGDQHLAEDLVQSAALVLISADGRKLSETPEPAALKDMQILQAVI